MNFVTKFGLGEIVYHTLLGHGKAKHDEFLEVVAITFDKCGVRYSCRYPKGLIGVFAECELIGDPDFDQNTGSYKRDITGHQIDVDGNEI